MTTTSHSCRFQALQQIRDALADEESFHVPADVIEWLDEQIDRHDINVHEVLANRQQIAVIWSVSDVQEVRPDLNEDQCWEVLQAAKHYHDANHGITWETLRWQAAFLFETQSQ